MAISLNPGFALLLAALVIWALPRMLRGPLMLIAALAALALPFAPSFGDHAVFGQFGLKVVPLRLDALSQWIGLAASVLAVVAALTSLSRSRRSEDALICLLLGGVLTAIYAGDLVTLVASASTAAFAVVGLALTDAANSDARAVGRRVMVWMALATLLMTAGAGVFLAEAKSVRFDLVQADNVGGVLLLLGFAILAGAPGAHVWIRDAAVRLSTTAAPFALTALPLFSVYGLARAYGGEPALCVIGAVMALGAAPFAIAAEDLRRALGFATVSAWGIPIAILGLEAPAALAGASAVAFTTAISLALCHLAAGAIFGAAGTASVSRLDAGGPGKAMPLSGGLFLIGALSLIGTPGLGGNVALAFALDGAADRGPAWLWPCLLAAGACAAGTLIIRIGLTLMAARVSPPSDDAAPPLLAMSVCLGASLGVALSPGWMYALLPPTSVNFDPYRPGDVLASVQLLAGGAASYGLLRLLALGPAGRDLPDLDVLWRGPGTVAGGWLGAMLLRAYQMGRSAREVLLRHSAAAVGGMAQFLESRSWVRLALPTPFIVLGAVALLLYLLTH